MFNITFNEKEYLIDEDKLIYVLERITQRKVLREEICILMEKYCLYDEFFLENVNRL